MPAPPDSLRVAVLDLGTNATRLLVADVRDGEVEARATVPLAPIEAGLRAEVLKRSLADFLGRQEAVRAVLAKARGDLANAPGLVNLGGLAGLPPSA